MYNQQRGLARSHQCSQFIDFATAEQAAAHRLIHLCSSAGPPRSRNSAPLQHPASNDGTRAFKFTRHGIE
jgi:hypothetical protein